MGTDPGVDAHRHCGIRVISSLQLPAHAVAGRVGLHRRDHYRSGRPVGAAGDCDVVHRIAESSPACGLERRSRNQQKRPGKPPGLRTMEAPKMSGEAIWPG